MTPRVRMTAVGTADTAEDIVNLATATGYSRFPVIGRDRDDVLGVLHVKQAFAVDLDERGNVTAENLMIEPLRVPESMGVDTLLGLLRRQGLQVAIVSDEHGGTAGIVTLEDLVEEIVGELEDEHDRARAGVVRVGRSITFDAALRPDELLDRTGIDVPDGEYDTVAGYVTDQLDRLPELGDEVEVDGGTLRVERVSGTHVERLRFTPAASGEPPQSPHDRIIDTLTRELTHE
jgi:CBS domain containing-hemolysin-like protein